MDLHLVKKREIIWLLWGIEPRLQQWELGVIITMLPNTAEFRTLLLIYTNYYSPGLTLDIFLFPAIFKRHFFLCVSCHHTQTPSTCFSTEYPLLFSRHTSTETVKMAPRTLQWKDNPSDHTPKPHSRNSFPKYAQRETSETPSIKSSRNSKRAWKIKP